MVITASLSSLITLPQRLAREADREMPYTVASMIDPSPQESGSWIARRYPALLIRDFRLLWIAQLISVTGSQMQNVAVAWQVFEITGSKAALGMIGLARAIPIMVLALIGGATADAFSRRRIMLITQTVMMLISGALAVLAVSGTFFTISTAGMEIAVKGMGSALGNPEVELAMSTGSWWTLPFIMVIGLTATLAAAGAFDSPARQSLIPSLVPPQHLPNALSLGTMVFQVSTVAGPALSGFAIAAFGVGGVYLINALTFISVIVALLMMRSVERRPEVRSQVSFAAVMEGLRYLKKVPLISSTMLLDFFATFFATASALLPAYAKEVLGTDSRGLGVLYSAEAIGSLVAGFIIVSLGEIRRQGRVLLAAVAFYGVATALFGLSTSFTVAFITLMLVGAGDAVSTVIRQTIRQVATPDNLRGRINAANMIFFMGGPQLGNFEAGIVAAALGTPFSIVIGGVAVVGVVAAMAVKFPVLRHYDRWNREEEVDE